MGVFILIFIIGFKGRPKDESDPCQLKPHRKAAVKGCKFESPSYFFHPLLLFMLHCSPCRGQT